MLSDTIHDCTLEMLCDLAWYKVNDYGYDSKQLLNVLEKIGLLAAIGVDYDLGGDGVKGAGSNLDEPNFERYVIARTICDFRKLVRLQKSRMDQPIKKWIHEVTLS